MRSLFNRKDVPFDDLIPTKLDRLDFIVAWKDWVQHRKEIGHKLTKTTARHQLKKCQRWGAETSIRFIHHALNVGWRGLFEPQNHNDSKALDDRAIDPETLK